MSRPDFSIILFDWTLLNYKWYQPDNAGFAKRIQSDGGGNKMGKLITSSAIYQKSLSADWAVGGFIGYDMEIMQASARAAGKIHAPVMLQASCRVVEYAGADMLRKMAEACAAELDRDVILHLDHGDSVERCKHCIDNGFTSVMLDSERDGFAENVRKTREVCEYAHARGAVVEGEVFHPIDSPEKYWTDVDEAVEYVDLTGCDSLAFCCGNAHDLPPDHPRKLRVEQIRAIHEALPQMPLVLHGTSILSPEFIARANQFGAGLYHPHNFDLRDIQESFRWGVCKVNSALDIKIAFTTAVRQYMAEHPVEMDPRKYLGYARGVIEDYIAQKHVRVFMDQEKA